MSSKYVPIARLLSAAALFISSCSMHPAVPANNKEMNLLSLGMNELLVNFDKLIPYTQNLVKQNLGEVRYQGFVFSGSCNTVGQLKGRLILDFLGTMPALLQQRLIRGTVVVDTVKDIGEITYSDQTDYYPVTESERVPTQQEMERVFKALQAELTTNNPSDCNLVVTQIGPKWNARCGHLEDFVQTCAYDVSEDGAVTRNTYE